MAGETVPRSRHRHDRLGIFIDQLPMIGAVGVDRVARLVQRPLRTSRRLNHGPAVEVDRRLVMAGETVSRCRHHHDRLGIFIDQLPMIGAVNLDGVAGPVQGSLGAPGRLDLGAAVRVHRGMLVLGKVVPRLSGNRDRLRHFIDHLAMIRAIRVDGLQGMTDPINGALDPVRRFQRRPTVGVQGDVSGIQRTVFRLLRGHDRLGHFVNEFSLVRPVRSKRIVSPVNGSLISQGRICLHKTIKNRPGSRIDQGAILCHRIESPVDAVVVDQGDIFRAVRVLLDCTLLDPPRSEHGHRQHPARLQIEASLCGLLGGSGQFADLRGLVDFDRHMLGHKGVKKTVVPVLGDRERVPDTRGHLTGKTVEQDRQVLLSVPGVELKRFRLHAGAAAKEIVPIAPERVPDLEPDRNRVRPLVILGKRRDALPMMRQDIIKQGLCRVFGNVPDQEPGERRQGPDLTAVLEDILRAAYNKLDSF